MWLLLASALAQNAVPMLPIAPTQDVTGIWNVISRPTGNGNCATAGDVASYIWVVAMQPDGAVSVSVQGQTSFGTLSGRVYGDRMLVSGIGVAQSMVVPVAWFELKLAGPSGTGRRIYSGGEDLGTGQGAHRACFLEYTVEAKKQ